MEPGRLFVPADGWWVYRKPLLRDRLFIAGLVFGVASLAYAVASLGDKGWLAGALSLLFAVPSGLLWVGIIGGIVRRYRTGRREG